MKLQNYTYGYRPGTDKQTTLLLHGVGGDETAMDQIGKLLVSESTWLTPKGPITVDGHARYFTRRADASFDPVEVTNETDKLAQFIDMARVQHHISADPLTAIGYSNGANMIASLLANHPALIKKAILFRGMLPVAFSTQPDLTDIDILLLNGDADHIMEKARVEQLHSYLADCGANVTLRWTKAGHQLATEDIAIAAQWLAS